jgi:hypothetical protein
MTKAAITLDSVHIGLFTGSAGVNGLVVSNPEGFKTPQAISIGVAEVGVNPLSILSDKVVIRSIHVEAPEITFEGGLGGNNLSKIMENVNDFVKTSNASSTNAAAKPGRKIEVDDFLITGAKIHVSFTGLGGKEMTLPLPDIHLTDLGKSGDGLTPAELIRSVLRSITSATIKVVTDEATSLGTSVENLGKNVTKGAVEGVDQIKKGIGGLFGN